MTAAPISNRHVAARALRPDAELRPLADLLVGLLPGLQGLALGLRLIGP